MEALRVSNIPHLACAPYKILKELSFIAYEEHNPVENLKFLREGKLDCALIPAVDFYKDGCYRSMGFGMGSRQRTESMMLYSNAPISKLDRVFVYSCSSSSTALLRLILKEKWNLSPEIVRLNTEDLDIPLQETDAMLSLHDLPGKVRSDFLNVQDLGDLWYRHTKLPFVFLIWAVRPGALSNSSFRELHKIMYIASRESRDLAIDYSSMYGVGADDAKEFVSENRRFQLDPFLETGLNEFLLRSKKHGFFHDYLKVGNHQPS